MKDEILINLDNPRQLEKLYRADKPSFKRAFRALYPDLKDNMLVNYWNERLNFAADELSWGNRKDLLFVVLASVLAGLLAKLPAFLSLDEEFFYTRNIGFIIFPLLTAYFAWKNQLSPVRVTVVAVLTLGGLIFINLLPDLPKSDTLILSCMHILLFLWSILAFAYVGDKDQPDQKRMGFLKYNGDLVVLTTLILIAGGILSGITIGLFSLINLNIEKFYFENIVVFCLPAVAIMGTYLTQNNPQLVGKVSPVIARLFSPLVLVMLVIYLIAIVFSGKDPYNDREFLLIFNVLLIGVMALIFFSIAETSARKTPAEMWILFLLSAVTIIINGIALSAILFRISEWGLTPNRAAVLGSNVLILVNLLLVTWQLFRVLSKKAEINAVGKVIGYYLPVYGVWAAIVTFLFPYLFGI